MIPSIPSGSFDEYRGVVHRIPILTYEEERVLVNKYCHEGDLDAAKQLITANLRFVLFIANGYKGYGFPLEDLVQEGNIGLMKAIKKFDPMYEIRIATYAVIYIKTAIHDYMINNWKMVKTVTTKTLRKLFFNKSSWYHDKGFTDREILDIAKTYDATTADVKRIITTFSVADLSMDDEESPLPQIQSHSLQPLEMVEIYDTELNNAKQVHMALSVLDDRSRDIIEKRWMGDGKVTLSDLSLKYGVSIERIRQLETSAMKKMRKAIC